MAEVSGKHKAVLDGVAALLATINGNPTYNYDLTGTNQVGLRIPIKGDYPVEVWVHAGSDEWGVGNSSPRSFDVFFDVLVTAFFEYHDGGVTLSEDVELFRHDLLLMILSNANAGGTCTDLVPLRTGEPEHDPDRNRAAVDFTLVAKLTDLSATAL